jgi:prolyl 4-hydroxylase
MSDANLQNALSLIENGRDEGVQMLRQIAAAGSPEALFVLADLTWSGRMVPQDPARGRLLFEYAAALGHSEANILATNLLASGVAGKRDWAAALERLDAEARQIPDRRAARVLLDSMTLDDNGDPVALPEPTILSERPDARIFEGLLTAAECVYLIQTAEPWFRPSLRYDSNGRAVRDTTRTSDGAAFHWLVEDPVVHAINRRVAAITATNYDQGEALQVLRYSPGQEYRPHFDFLEGTDNPRPWTALLYLNEEYQGGATAFVKTGLEVRGNVGDVLVFRNEGPDGRREPLAEHAGLPITAGTKYLATRWIRERRWIP